MKKENPFSSLSSKEANMLMILSGAIENQNEELGKNTILQLADELEILEANSLKQTKNTTISVMISIVSGILTFFFGAVSFIQFTI